jgi:hypothetical protein
MCGNHPTEGPPSPGSGLAKGICDLAGAGTRSPRWTGACANSLEVRGADTGLKPAQAAHSANPAQRKINDIMKTEGIEKPQTCSIPAPGTTIFILKSARRAARRRTRARCIHWWTGAGSAGGPGTSAPPTPARVRWGYSAPLSVVGRDGPAAGHVQLVPGFGGQLVHLAEGDGSRPEQQQSAVGADQHHLPPPSEDLPLHFPI